MKLLKYLKITNAAKYTKFMKTLLQEVSFL